MLGRATFVMKKSMIGRNAPASRMNTPTAWSPPARAIARGAVGRGSAACPDKADVMTAPPLVIYQ